MYFNRRNVATQPLVPLEAVSAETNAIRNELIKICDDYMQNYRLIKNTHHNIAEAVKSDLAKLNEYQNDSFQKEVIQAFVLGLENYLEVKDSKKFSQAVLAFKIKYPGTFSDMDAVKAKYQSEINALVGYFNYNCSSLLPTPYGVEGLALFRQKFNQAGNVNSESHTSAQSIAETLPGGFTHRRRELPSATATTTKAYRSLLSPSHLINEQQGVVGIVKLNDSQTVIYHEGFSKEEGSFIKKLIIDKNSPRQKGLQTFSPGHFTDKVNQSASSFIGCEAQAGKEFMAEITSIGNQSNITEALQTCCQKYFGSNLELVQFDSDSSSSILGN
ncbi:hypothetical protein ACFORL_02620 [Legionella dresdenensis]|uniref:Substrate of the Dot/Icm secretion system n=1 Tax=Legionella dresdenensis TaxID=450200 RepID=A0ABV8CCD2_9GAMM